MKRSKNSAKRIVFDSSPTKCWFCSSSTFYVLYDFRDSSEVFACPVCIRNHGKVRRFKPKISNSPSFTKSVKKLKNLRVKNLERPILNVEGDI